MPSSPPPRVALVVGKRPRPGTLVADVADRLRHAGAVVDVLLPHDDPQVLRLPSAPDLLVHRGLRADVMSTVVALEEAGVPCCNPARAAVAVDDRSAVVRRLAAAGVPVPRSTTCASWSQVRDELGRGPAVVKAATDPTGRSARVALLPAPVARPPFDGPWLVQEHVASDGLDRKLYVTGARVRGLLKPALAQHRDEQVLDGPAPSRPFAPQEELADLARAVGRALGLHLFGVDVLVGPQGPVVVDVNVLPGYRGVAGAAAQVTDHLLGHLAPG